MGQNKTTDTGLERTLEELKREIQKSKQVQNELRDNAKKYQSLYQELLDAFNAIPDSISMISPELKILWANKKAAVSFNITLSEMIGQYCYKVRHNRSEPCEICPVQRSFHSKKHESNEINTIDAGIIELRAAPVIDDRGEVKCVIAGDCDITERKRAEKVLRESEERYRSLVENINLGITLLGTDYRIIMTNTGMGKLFNKSPDALKGKYCYREFEQRREVCPHCPGTIAMATGHPAETDTTGIRDDGSNFEAHLYTFPIFGQNKEIKGFVEVVEDCTGRKRSEEQMILLQEQLLQSQKMEAIGCLAGGVAHDFNNHR